MKVSRVGTTARWSDAVIFNNVVYMVEVPTSLDADLATQTKELLALIENALVNYGSDKAHILSATIYLTDITQIEVFNKIWDKWLPAKSAPSRACVEAKLANPNYKVEIQLTAAVLDKPEVRFMT